MSAPIEVVEYTDPGCVWSWGSEPQLRWLRRHYGDQLRWRRVLGVQVDRLSETHPTRDAVRDAEAFRDDWLAVAVHTDAPVPVRLDRQHRSTRPASHAVRAAERQVTAEHPDVADRVLRRLREAVFVHGRPADTRERIADALAGVDGLDLDRLLGDLDDPEVLASVQADWEETRRPHPAVIGRTGPGPNPGGAKPDGERTRYGFPTLLLRGPAGEEVVSGWNDVAALARAVESVGARPVDTARTLDPDEALARYRTLTAADLRITTGGREPLGAVRIDTATTPIWVHPDEAPPTGAEHTHARTASGAAAV
ncbi:DsbA family oxidoreductase [Patulibacter minatonensis]|uniref:DsbA family oxidoreductase n=1 Tax=Patulibacter minatonensis TaxID=298163 RepID=UPI000688EB85|nr:DsbA family protein [Patulibacter minatonensis]